MTPQELRTNLITLLSKDNLLGTYKTKSGKTYQACTVTPPLIDPSYTITGLQVSIFASPEVQNVKPLTGSKLKRYWWVVELVQNDVNQSIRPAIELIEDYYPVTISRTKPQTRTEYEQARISVYDPQFTGLSGCYQSQPVMPVPVPFVNSLNFTDSRNSQYTVLL